MKKDEPSISVIIRNRNEAEFLPLVLASLRRQQNVRIEIILVDNASEDNSVDIARRFGCRIVTIEKGAFSYGYGINVGMKMASSEVCVLLSAHSMLIGPYALQGCIEAFNDPSVGAVRFINSDKKFDIRRWISPEVLQGELGVDTVVSKGPLANGCAIRKSLWEEIRFDESIPAAEEKLWAIEILKFGYKIYSPSPVIYCYLKSLSLAARIKKNNRELLAIYAATGAKLSHLREGLFRKARRCSIEMVSSPVVAFVRTFIRSYLELTAYLRSKRK